MSIHERRRWRDTRAGKATQIDSCTPRKSSIFQPLLPVNHLARAVMLRLNGSEYMRLLL